jgi:hypothetical protein
MVGNFYWYPFPELSIFPRSKNSLFSYHANLRGEETGLIAFNNSIPSFEDCPEGVTIQDYKNITELTTLKNIDYRLYVDLWSAHTSKYHTETCKKITLCFLNNLDGDKYSIFHKTEESLKPEAEDYFHLIKVKIKVDSKDTNKHIAVEYRDKMGTLKRTASEWMEIPITDFNEKYMLELNIRVYDSTRNLPSAEKSTFEIITTLERNTFCSMKEQKLELTLYRHDNKMNCLDTNPLSYYRKNEKDEDHDFFVLPRTNQTDDHEKIIKRLQLLNNQVIARHKKLSDSDFSFLDEDGTYCDDLGKALKNSLQVFRETKAATYEQIKSLSPCNFAEYGQAKKLINYLSQNYSMSEDELKKIIVDRNFLFGEDDQNTHYDKLYGLESLYQNIIIPFNEGLIKEAEKYVNFNKAWLSRPKNNPHYQRGNFVVGAEDKIQVFTHETENVFLKTIPGLAEEKHLPIGTKINFHPGADIHDHEEGAYRYDISNLKMPNGHSKDFEKKTAYISLTRKQKMRCNDKAHPENYGNYTNIKNITDARDIAALNLYGKSYGVPYYMSDDEYHYGGKDVLSTFDHQLNSIPNNWYSYNETQKPSAPRSSKGADVSGIGLDCSGLVMNCLLDTKIHDQSLFQEIGDIRSVGTQARKIGKYKARLINIDKESGPNHSIIQAGDLFYSTKHVSLCAITQRSYLSKMEKEEKYFSIIHNYGQSSISMASGASVSNGHFHRTLKGPFRHWNAVLTNNPIPDHADRGIDANAGRIYLWY